jgi:hypothetical protein
MATVRLSHYECRKDLFPDVCTWCGEPASKVTYRNFSWYPQWIVLLFLISPLIMLIVAVIMTKRMAAHLPFCEQHRNHWGSRNFWSWMGFIGLVVAIATCIGTFQNLDPQQQDDLIAPIALGCIGLGLAWLIALVIVNQKAIRAVEITETRLAITNVHPEFINALDDLREEVRQERDARDDRDDRYDDERDDYDDDRDRRRRR